MRNNEYETHRWDQVVENIHFLTQAGEHFDHIAHRLGYEPDSLRRQMERHGERQQDPDPVTATREGEG